MWIGRMGGWAVVPEIQTRSVLYFGGFSKFGRTQILSDLLEQHLSHRSSFCTRLDSSLHSLTSYFKGLILSTPMRHFLILGISDIRNHRNTMHSKNREWGASVEQAGGVVKFHPLSDPGSPFLIRTIKCRNPSMPKFNGNKRFTSFGVHMPGLQVPILRLRAPSQAQKGPS